MDYPISIHREGTKLTVHSYRRVINTLFYNYLMSMTVVAANTGTNNRIYDTVFSNGRTTFTAGNSADDTLLVMEYDRPIRIEDLDWMVDKVTEMLFECKTVTNYAVRNLDSDSIVVDVTETIQNEPKDPQ